MATRNLPTYFIDTTQKRTVEVPAADWDGGVNPGASCAPGIGINTGDIDPTVGNWPDSNFNGVKSIPYFGASGHIGIDSGVNNRISVVQDADVNDHVEFVVAQQDTAPDAGLGAAGTEPLNRTGATVPTGARVWGTRTVA